MIFAMLQKCLHGKYISFVSMACLANKCTFNFSKTNFLSESEHTSNIRAVVDFYSKTISSGDQIED